jgi:ABC-type Fe3+-hydroxamate transport system substrate-binding protein
MSLVLHDARGYRHAFAHPPERIVSLVPSLTATLFDLDQGRRLVGCTDYCELPAGYEAIPRLGGTKNPKRFAIRDLRPDLILMNIEENRRYDAEWFEQAGLPVFATFPRSPAQALAEIANLAALCGVAGQPAWEARRQRVQAYLTELEQRRRALSGPRTRFFVAIWKDPWMTANAETYVSALLELSGAVNVFADRRRRFPLAFELGLSNREDEVEGLDTRYPRLRLEELVTAAPDVILLPSEPWGFGPVQVAELLADPDLQTVPAIRQRRLHLVDGRPLLWHSLGWLEQALASLTSGQLAAILAPTPVPSL